MVNPDDFSFPIDKFVARELKKQFNETSMIILITQGDDYGRVPYDSVENKQL
jgi:hypothetical protein